MLCALFLTLTFAAGTVLWIAAEFFTGVVWIIAYVLPDYDHCRAESQMFGLH